MTTTSSVNKECRCGNSYGKYGRSDNLETDCATPCAKDPTVMCGGYWFESVYSH